MICQEILFNRFFRIDDSSVKIVPCLSLMTFDHINQKVSNERYYTLHAVSCLFALSMDLVVLICEVIFSFAFEI